MLKTLLGQVKQYRTAALLTPLWTTAEVLMGVLIPYVTASLIDKGINAGDMGQVYRFGGIMVLMSCLSLMFGILSGRTSAYSSTGFAANLREAMYRNIQRFSFSDIDKFSTAGLVTRMTTDVSNLQRAFQMLLRVSFRAPLNLVFSLFMCFFINARLSLVFLVAMVVLTTSLFFLIRRASKLFVQVFERYDALNGTIQENISAIRVVKAFVREDHELGKFDKAALSLYTLNVKSESLMALNHPVMNLVVYGCIIALSWFGAHYVVDETLTTGQLTSLFTYIMTLMSSLMMLSMIFVQLTMSAASGKRVAEVIDEVPDMYDPEDPVFEVKDGSIDFDGVSFSYIKDGDKALEGIDLHIDAGQTIGVIGGTGCGKTSLVNLIPRLYDVCEGSVKVGGVDVRDYDMMALRSQVAMVLQKNTLFSGTVMENLRWGREDATDEECIEACRQACADEFIEAMPDGYGTFIEQGGTNVSGGQRQRLCIARALLKRPKILILDDSTSAVDTATDARIRAAFSVHVPGVTKIIISQRILSVRDADRIAVMDNGRIVAFDTHEALLKTCEIYKDIHEMQSSGAEGDFDEKEKKR
ncbi:MAG: ABC transporter ATP-binding protein/permease [Bacteroidales bacterium]|nr:ABC transporter ATP-binding protein/permease [Bacteroidales bacterium]